MGHIKFSILCSHYGREQHWLRGLHATHCVWSFGFVKIQTKHIYSLLMIRKEEHIQNHQTKLSEQFFTSLYNKIFHLRMIHEFLSGSRNFSKHMVQHYADNSGDTAGVNLSYFLYAVNRWHEVSHTILKRNDQSFKCSKMGHFHCVHFVLLCLKPDIYMVWQ